MIIFFKMLLEYNKKLNCIDQIKNKISLHIDIDNK